MSLTVSRHKVLIQDGTGKDLSFDAKLQVNNGFTSDKIKVQVSLIKKEEKAAETTTLAEAPVERKHVIDAAIVRIMKSRNRLEHNALLEEVFRQCTLFKPQPTQIKGQIESRQVEFFNLFWSYLKLVSLLVTTLHFCIFWLPESPRNIWLNVNFWSEMRRIGMPTFTCRDDCLSSSGRRGADCSSRWSSSMSGNVAADGKKGSNQREERVNRERKSWIIHTLQMNQSTYIFRGFPYILHTIARFDAQIKKSLAFSIPSSIHLRK